MNKIPTGSRILDNMLDGGYDPDIITTVYGPGGSGKTVLCLLCAINIAKDGKKVIYVDTEGSFSVERLKQITSSINIDYKKILNNIVFLRPTRFEEQKKSFEKLKDIVTDRIGLIIVDTIAMLYRLELGKNEDVYGFSSCENYERCCCGFEVEEESSGDVEENSSNDASSETVDKGPLAENLFLPLILLVILLALAVLLKKKAFRREEEKKDEEIKEE